ncbi:hypothetical protein ACNKU7_15425 [Microbulbifer sp. SA54]|uniref:hypothetical protein n=1 Tax=Microbulbifer sp. SA54 TaxID=3401577 RepID=UPI003AAABB61
MDLFRHIRPGILKRAIIIAALALPGAVAAQETNNGEDNSAGENAAEDSVTAQPVAVGSAQQTQQQVQQTKKPTQTIKAQSADSADSYEASEEISEDLSVSYPVDI